VQRYVLTSSIATIGPPRAGKGYSDERDFPDATSLACVYHAVKAAVEEAALAAPTAGPDVVALVPTAVMGELDVKAGTGSLIVAVGNRALPFRVDGPTNLVDADDLARALILAAERGASGERYIVGGHNLSVTALLRSVADLLGLPLDAPLLPADVAGFRALLGEARVRAAGKGERAPISRELVDMARFGRHVLNTKAQRELGLPAPTPLRVTLKKACDWYARHRYIRPAEGAPHARDIRVSDPS
jgi:dihydroflavonol-4-reductase